MDKPTLKADADRELLEAAARAIGMELRYNYLGLRDANQPWDPLTDDGDAFRLAVKLQIDVLNASPTLAQAVRIPALGYAYADEDQGSDPYAATRRAIVRAAAALAPQPAEVK